MQLSSFKMAVFVLLISILGFSSLGKADEKNIMLVHLKSFELFNSPILASNTYYFRAEDGIPIEIACSRNILLEPIMLVRLFPDRQTPYLASMKVESAKACNRSVHSIVEATQNNHEVMLELNDNEDDQYKIIRMNFL